MGEPLGSDSSPPGVSLPADGERFIPGSMTGEIELEHIHRYKFAAQLCTRKVVLDIACGEGYGSAYLATVARRVTGVDIAESAIAHARDRYRLPNLEYAVGECAAIPLGKATVDVVVSFETIEHLSEHEAMLREIRRVLRPRGTLIISSPDKLEYSDKPGLHNPFHVKELYREEFQALLDRHFKHARYFGQRVLYGSALFLEAPAQELEFHDVAMDSRSQDFLGAPKYWVAVASNAPLRTLKGGLLEGDVSQLGAAGDLASAKAAGAILKAIAGPASSRLREKLHDPWYLQRNSDVTAEGVDPFEHWMRWGAAEGRLPAPDVESLALELMIEKEAPVQAALERSEGELRDARADWLARQHALGEMHSGALMERERAFGEQVTQLQKLAAQEREAQRAALADELSATRAEFERREQQIRAQLAQDERDFRQREQGLLERQRALESELEKTRLAARQQIEAQLRAQADREREFAELLLQQQRRASEEQQQERQSANALAQLILSQREQTEQRLQAAIADREREVRDLRREALDHQKAQQATLAQHRVALQYANDSRSRALADQERAFAEQLSRQQQLARDEREQEDVRQRAQLEEQVGELRRNSTTLLERLGVLEEELEETRLTSRSELETQLRALAERERQFADELSQVQRRAQETLTGAHEAAARRLTATHAEHEQQLRSLEAALSASRSREREQAATHLRMVLERERSFAQELTRVRDLIEEERRLVRAQYLHATDTMRAKLIASQQHAWWRKMLPWNYSTLASDLLQTWLSCAAEIIATAPDAEGEASHAATPERRPIRAAKSLEELLARDDDDFISCLYLSLLGRPPDPKGYRFYLEKLRSTGDKADIIANVARSREARERKLTLPGLGSFVLRRRLANLPLLGWLALGPAARGEVNAPRILFEEIQHRITQLEAEVSHRESQLPPTLTDPGEYVSAVLASFDADKYAAANPDVNLAGVNPYEHFVRFGWNERRSHSDKQTELAGRSETASGEVAEPAADTADQSLGPWRCVMQPAPALVEGQLYPLTRMMHFVWSSRTDLQQAFDIRTAEGRLAYLDWLASHGLEECELSAAVFPRSLLRDLASVRGRLGELAVSVLSTRESAAGGTASAAGSDEGFGANLVGYAFGEFGRGEDIRMLARSLDRVRVPVCVIDQKPGQHGTRDHSAAKWVTDKPRFAANIFLVNADLFPFLPFRLGYQFSTGRYNIGYWAWELSQWPAEFALALEMVDEVWAISTFVAESVKTRAHIPVFVIPNAVTVPQLGPSYTKARYGLPPESFVFYFIFDGASHIDRKNPIAVLKAFRLAFQSDDDVHLLIKGMNVEAAGPLWEELLEEASACERVTIITDRMTREELLGLHVACDAFVSLHRSEGFGRCIAEAMAYGKPAIVTNYSGSRDFARDGTACVVDYRLIPVAAGSYPFSDGQVWAEPDVEHAATLMQRVARDVPYREQIAEAGQKYVLENFSEAAVGRLSARRLSEIGASRRNESQSDVGSQQEGGSETGIFGNVDNPVIGSSPRTSEMLSIEGWATSRDGIEAVRIFVDNVYVADAHYGTLRPDVYSAFPECPGAGRSGFCLLLNLARYADGDHPFRVVAVSGTGASKAWNGLFTKTPSASYSVWAQGVKQAYAKVFEASDARSGEVGFSVVLRLDTNVDVDALTRTFASLAEQAYPNIELICLLAQEQHQPLVAEAVRRVALNVEPRYVEYDRENWLAALAHCRGDFLGLLDPGDTFQPLSLRIIDKAIRDGGFPDLVYADEEIRAGGSCSPLFKPGWSPIFLASHNYVGRPWFASRKTVHTVLSRWPAANDPVSEHELLKAIGICSSAVAHVPNVLVSREGPISDGHAQGLRGDEVDEPAAGGVNPKVSIIIPTTLGNEAIVATCFDALEHMTDYPEFEVIVVVNNVKDPTAVARLVAPRPFRILDWSGGFNWAAINNFGASQSKGDLLLFMNDDIEPLGPKWLTRLVRSVLRTGAGAAGCLLQYGNGTIQHGGINFVSYGGGARHLFRFCTGDEARLQWLLKHTREVSAVTGACLLTTRDCFDEAHGFDEELALVGNDTDYCLRVWQRGRPVIFEPHAALIHYEGISRSGMAEDKDVKRFWSKWCQFLERGDFFCNPNIDMSRDDWWVNPAIDKVFPVRTRQLHGGNSGVIDDVSPVNPAPRKTARGL